MLTCREEIVMLTRDLYVTRSTVFIVHLTILSVVRTLWRGHLVISSLWAGGFVFWLLLEMAGTHSRQTTSNPWPLGFPSLRRYACPIKRSAIWHTFIPSMTSGLHAIVLETSKGRASRLAGSKA